MKISVKHEPLKKFSARSTGMTSLLDVPYKSNERYRKGNALYNSNPVRMGEQEYINFSLLNQPKVLAEFLKTYSSSNTHRNAMLEELLTTDLEDIDQFTTPEHDVPSNSTQAVRAVFRGIGVQVEYVPDEDE